MSAAPRMTAKATFHRRTWNEPEQCWVYSPAPSPALNLTSVPFLLVELVVAVSFFGLIVVAVTLL